MEFQMNFRNNIRLSTIYHNPTLKWSVIVASCHNKSISVFIGRGLSREEDPTFMAVNKYGLELE